MAGQLELKANTIWYIGHKKKNHLTKFDLNVLNLYAIA